MEGKNIVLFGQHHRNDLLLQMIAEQCLVDHWFTYQIVKNQGKGYMTRKLDPQLKKATYREAVKQADKIIVLEELPTDVESLMKDKEIVFLQDIPNAAKAMLNLLFTLPDEVQAIGRDMVSGLPRTITVGSEEVEEALRESVSVIVQAAKSVLERTPPELSADIIDRGVILTGGGALLHGMDMLLAEELKVPVLVAEDPMDCVAIGTGIMLENMDKISSRRFG